MAVTAAAHGLYQRLLKDEVLAPFFKGVDMDRQVRKQIGFLTLALGGPTELTAPDLTAAHARLKGLEHSHFDRVAQHLDDTLQELGVEDEHRAQIARVLESTRAAVMGAHQR